MCVPRILVAEDDAEMRKLIVYYLQRDGYDVEECSHGVDLIKSLVALTTPMAGARFDLVISDIRMPLVSGLDTLECLGRLCKLPPLILMTAFWSDENSHQARRLNPRVILEKPFEMSELVKLVRGIVPNEP